jgi:hypothetical protein
MKVKIEKGSMNQPEETEPLVFSRLNTSKVKITIQKQNILIRILKYSIMGFCGLVPVLFCVLHIMGHVNNCKNVKDLSFDPVDLNYNQVLESETTDQSFAIIGDFQRTSWIECAISREVNDDETEIIVKAIARTSPGFIALLGDFVFDGNDQSHWKHFDYTIQEFARLQIPLFPVLGNHDYCSDTMYIIESKRCNNDVASQEYSKRFPASFLLSNKGKQTSWYSRLYGSKSMGGAQLGMIFLDSNFYRLDEEEWESQMKWLNAVISDIESNERVRGILFFAHHPPFTNSLSVSGDKHVKQHFLPVFCRAHKSMTFFTGHAHGLEHFVHDCSTELQGTSRVENNASRHFVVTGGGGGPRPARGLHQANYRNYYDILGETKIPRPFNFVRVSFLLGPNDKAREVKTGIRVEAHGINKGEKAVRLLHQFDIFWPKKRSNKFG